MNFIDDSSDDHDSEPVANDTNMPRPLDTLARTALATALGDDAEILQGEGIAVVAIVAEPDWMPSIRRAFVARRKSIHVWTAGTGRHAGFSDADVARVLGQSIPAVGVAATLAVLPQALVRSADLRLEIRPPTGPALAQAIAEILGGDPPAVDAAFGAGLRACEMAACIRAHGAPDEAVARILRAQRAAAGVIDGPRPPRLDELHGYGAAMSYCRALAADVAAYRAGQIGWREVRGAAVLASPPGCGKTTLVASLASEIGVPLIATSVASWFTAFRDGALDDVIRAATASHAAATAQAQATGLAIWFIDEIDALPDRATLDGRGRDWWAPVVTHVLTLLDGALAAPGVVVIAATNHADRLDAALVRPGRLSRIVEIGPAAAGDVVGILRVHLRGDLIDEDLSALAPLGAGRTGADLAQVVQEARGAARLAGRALVRDDLARALAPPTSRPPERARRVCVHEAGHAVVAHALGYRIQSISMIPRGQTGGHAMIEDPGHGMPVLADIEDSVRINLGGRAAEEVVLGAPSASAAADLAQATRSLAAAHAAWGLGARLAVAPSPEMDPTIARAVEADLRRLYADARAILVRERLAVDALSAALARALVLDEDAIKGVIADARRKRRRRR